MHEDNNIYKSALLKKYDRGTPKKILKIIRSVQRIIILIFLFFLKIRRTKEPRPHKSIISKEIKKVFTEKNSDKNGGKSNPFAFNRYDTTKCTIYIIK